MFVSRARWEAGRSAAQRAKDAAAEAFVALDESHTMVSALVDAFAGVDAGPDGARLRAELAPALTASDRASHSWIVTLDAHGPALDDDSARLTQFEAGLRAFEQALHELQAARQGLEQFRARHADLEDRLEQVVSRVRPAVHEAQRALEEARREVAATRSAGLASPELERRLAEADRLGLLVAEGPHRHGADATLRGASKLVEVSSRITEQARRLAGLKDATSGRLVSTRTRLDGVVSRLEEVGPTLSLLRRRFSARCSDDLDHVPATGARAIAEARRLLDEAVAATRDEAWERAADRLEAARDLIGEAEAGVNAVVSRRRDLEAVAADPAHEKAKARFAVRDAQTLVVTAGGAAPAGERTILDSLAARLDRVEEKLEGTHPDYWAYLTELRAIREIAAGVVRRTREALAARRS